MQISGREASEQIKVFKDINDLKDTPHNYPLHKQQRIYCANFTVFFCSYPKL